MTVFYSLAALGDFQTLWKTSGCQAHSRSYLTTDCFSPVSSSWLQVPWDQRSLFFSNEPMRSYTLSNIPSDVRMGLSFTLAAGPCHRSHFQVRVLQDSWPCFTVSDSRLLKPGGPRSRIYNLQEEGGPVISTSRHWVPFRRLLRLAGLQWRYLNPPPHALNFWLITGCSYIASARTEPKNITFSNSSAVVSSVLCLGNIFSVPLTGRLFRFL
jgi:hypothetical protein